MHSAAPPLEHDDHVEVPRGALRAIAALILATLLAVAWVQLSGGAPSSASTAPVVVERWLQFSDLPDGRIEVREDGHPLATLSAGAHGFLRGALRALARERRVAGLAAQVPLAASTPTPAFRLRAHADGRLSLDDPATGVRIDLESFGPTNTADFAQLLHLPALAPSR
ncbi:photosynthetic complex assembly protein PuhC [Ideonella sp. 4Y16]|uniref:Photosynthetic complex assembly protein PuhC n=1 Tax=Ideonella alba TaxID=2824118 RepID=A0A941BGB7_9BURK|nr:photosynthetic complex assembly protein PuhC [Ideonella alba]MBQ0930348.1 photosynthetic complex assembly protein PuhC [Ideonella alba]MBQ0943410.1 photosynthetic complex assembly protein PuhC [Ideonella alba]